MLHIEYAQSDYKGSYIDIQPQNASEIPGLIDMVNRNLIIENPAKTFALRHENGGYSGWTVEDIDKEAEIANAISELWDNEPDINAIMLVSRALQRIVDLTVGKRDTIPEKTVLEELEDDDDEIPPDWFKIK